MIKTASVTSLTLLLLAGAARADLPKNFDWDEDAVSKVASRHPEQLDGATPVERARIVAVLLGNDDHSGVVKVLERAPALDRFQTLSVLDRSNDTTVRKVYDALDKGEQARLLTLVQEAGNAGTAAGRQQVGIVSDCDDTAFPTAFTPDGATTFKGSGDFFRLVEGGSDGKGDPGNLHFVTARPPILFGSTRERLEAAGMPSGTFDGDSDMKRWIDRKSVV
jgi:hypothetical protein